MGVQVAIKQPGRHVSILDGWTVEARSLFKSIESKWGIGADRIRLTFGRFLKHLFARAVTGPN